MSRVLIFGISGMLGSATFNVFAHDANFEVLGTVRNGAVKQYFSPELHENIITGTDVLDDEKIKLQFFSHGPIFIKFIHNIPENIVL